jgi:hypothetical protein
MTLSLAPARAAAARRNGALSRGPKTAAGKARSAQNALKHGLCAQKFVVLRDEDAQAYAALEAAVLAELAPQGVVQRLLAGRMARAAWRVERAERIENELFEFRQGGEENLALALIRDGNGTRSFETLMRYRGSALAEFYRALRTLRELQAEAEGERPAAAAEQPNEPKPRANPHESRRTHPAGPEPSCRPCAGATHAHRSQPTPPTNNHSNPNAAGILANAAQQVSPGALPGPCADHLDRDEAPVRHGAAGIACHLGGEVGVDQVDGAMGRRAAGLDDRA